MLSACRALVLLLCGFAAGLLPGCQPSAGDGPAGQQAAASEHRILRDDLGYAAFFRFRESLDGWEILDVAASGEVLAGERIAVPPNGTFALRFHATLLDASGHPVSLSLPDPLRDARFSPDGRSLGVLDDSERLSVLDRSTGASRVVDDSVYAGFGFSSDGRYVAYSKGDAPMLDAWLWDGDLGAAQRLTHSNLPTWGFSFAPGDSSLAFVHSPYGFPSLYSIQRDGSGLQALTNLGVTEQQVRSGHRLAPFPDGRKPPFFVASTLVFESERGVFALQPGRGVVWEKPGATRLFRGRAPGEIHYHAGGLDYAVRLGDKP
jgi:hypothetical protein